jgi:hypothetical protein
LGKYSVVKQHASPLKILFLSCALLFALSACLTLPSGVRSARTIFSPVRPPYTRHASAPNSQFRGLLPPEQARRLGGRLPRSPTSRRSSADWRSVRPCRPHLLVSPSSAGFALVSLAGGQSNPNPPLNSEPPRALLRSAWCSGAIASTVVSNCCRGSVDLRYSV